MSTLIIIPARAGSKGLPGKNTNLLFNKPLISYSVEFALDVKSHGDIICVTSNDSRVFEIIERYNNVIKLHRSEELSNDTAGMSSVVLNAIEFCENQNFDFDKILLLQPTSPLRVEEDYFSMCKLLDSGADMVVSVVESKANPYFNLFEEDDSGFLIKSKVGTFSSRQESPKVFEYNGSMYLIKKDSVKLFGLHGIRRIKKYVMPFERSIDIDTHIDWKIAEYIFKM